MRLAACSSTHRGRTQWIPLGGCRSSPGGFGGIFLGCTCSLTGVTPGMNPPRYVARRLGSVWGRFAVKWQDMAKTCSFPAAAVLSLPGKLAG